MITSNEKLDGAAVERKSCTGEPVWVQCEGFRCLAVLDKQGQWHSFCNRSELLHVLKVLEEPSPD
jgi:hypothetical protein